MNPETKKSLFGLASLAIICATIVAVVWIVWQV